MVKFGLSLGVADVKQAIEEAVLAEKCGFDGIWMADHIRGLLPDEKWGEAWTTMSAIAVKTRKIRLYCGVTDPLRRHPAQTAQTVATLDRISDGRVGVGIGAGESMNLLPFGLEWRKQPLQRLREAVEVIKMMLESSYDYPVSYSGKFFQLSDTFLQIKPVQKPRPPVLVGALGKKNRELTGEISDGWFSWLQSAETLKEGISDLRRGAERTGRKTEDLEIAVPFPFSVSKSREEAWNALCEGTKQNLVFERNVLLSMGYTEAFKKDLAIQWAMPTLELSRRLEKTRRLVPDEAVEAVSIYGKPEDCIEKIEEFVKIGAKWVVLITYPPEGTTDTRKTLKTIERTVLQYFR